MYKKDNLILIIIILLSLVYAFFVNIKYNYSDIITTLAIIIGFQSSSLAIMFSSQKINDLYLKKDIENEKITVLHRIKNYYKFFISISLMSILLLLMIPDNNFNLNFYCFHLIIGKSSFIPCIIIVNIYNIYCFNKLLCKLLTYRG